MKNKQFTGSWNFDQHAKGGIEKGKAFIVPVGHVNYGKTSFLSDMKLAQIDTLRVARERWAQLSDSDKQIVIQLAKNWQMIDLLPKAQ